MPVCEAAPSTCGHLAGILSLATKAQRPLGERPSSHKIGWTRNTRFLRLVEKVIPRLAASNRCPPKAGVKLFGAEKEFERG
jgi:hypothetical protein